MEEGFLNVKVRGILVFRLGEISNFLGLVIWDNIWMLLGDVLIVVFIYLVIVWIWCNSVLRLLSRSLRLGMGYCRIYRELFM